MKYSLLALLLSTAIFVQAQTSERHENSPSTTYVEGIISDKQKAIEFASTLVNGPSRTVLYASKTSLTGNHFHFVQKVNGYDVYHGQLAIHTDHNGRIVLIQNGLVDVTGIEISANAQTADNSSEYTWIMDRGFWVLARWELADAVYGRWHLKYDGHILAERSSKLFNAIQDSTVHAQVFLVNPLNSAGKKYGSPYIDSSDLDVPVLNAERKWVEMKAEYKNGKFWLNASRYGFGNVSDPVTPKTFSLNDTFSFMRSMTEFEDVNAFYHITAYSKHVEDLGFGNLLPDSLLIDAHAYNGADLSSFNFEVNPLELEFGEGGVDDAEDGEVVVHEFGHALSYQASPLNVEGKQRQAMEEGNCDYFSTSYSRQYSDFGWKQIFNWDGHNPFWSGIETGVSKMYPDDLTNSTNDDRALWSSPLMCIYDKLGKGIADTLVLEHLFYQTKNTTMPQMALAILSIDSMLWNKKYYTDIKECFVQYGILKWGTTVSSELIDNEGIKVLNSNGFANNTSELVVQSNKGDEMLVQLYNLAGQLLYSNSGINEIKINPLEFSSGIYVLNIQQKDVNLSVKLIKQ